MKSFKYLGLGLIATTVLGAAPVFAAEGQQEEIKGKDTATEVVITAKEVHPETPVDPRDPTDPKDKDRNDIAVLKFVDAPTAYKFTTQLKADGEYKIDSGTVEGQGFKVFSDAKGAHYQVKSEVKGGLVSGTGADQITADVTKFFINGKDIKESANSIVMNHTEESGKYGFETSAGERTKAVDSIGIEFKVTDGQETKVKDGTVFTGTIENTLYNVYSVNK